MLLDVSSSPIDILLLDSQVNEKVIKKRKNIRGMIRLIITKSSHHPTNKKPHECEAIDVEICLLFIMPMIMLR